MRMIMMRVGRYIWRAIFTHRFWREVIWFAIEQRREPKRVRGRCKFWQQVEESDESAPPINVYAKCDHICDGGHAAKGDKGDQPRVVTALTREEAKERDRNVDREREAFGKGACHARRSTSPSGNAVRAHGSQPMPKCSSRTALPPRGHSRWPHLV